ncbi:MAG: actin cross-linking domain-containing toxin [Cyanobacteria bacterium P01_D01_bin.56]
MVYQRKKRTHEQQEQLPINTPQNSLFASPDLETDETDNSFSVDSSQPAPTLEMRRQQASKKPFYSLSSLVSPPSSAVQRRPQSPLMQAKQTDDYWQRVIARQDAPGLMPESGKPAVQRAVMADDAAVQKAPEGGAGGSQTVDLTPKGSGSPLPKQVADNFVQSGYPEVAQARVHVDDGATQSIQAKAYTQKNNIVVQSSGANDPKLLGHEATHVVQQSQMALKPDVNGTPINANPALEKNADDNGERVARNESVSVKGASVTGQPETGMGGANHPPVQRREDGIVQRIIQGRPSSNRSPVAAKKFLKDQKKFTQQVIDAVVDAAVRDPNPVRYADMKRAAQLMVENQMDAAQAIAAALAGIPPAPPALNPNNNPIAYNAPALPNVPPIIPPLAPIAPAALALNLNNPIAYNAPALPNVPPGVPLPALPAERHRRIDDDGGVERGPIKQDGKKDIKPKNSKEESKNISMASNAATLASLLGGTFKKKSGRRGAEKAPDFAKHFSDVSMGVETETVNAYLAQTGAKGGGGHLTLGFVRNIKTGEELVKVVKDQPGAKKWKPPGNVKHSGVNQPLSVIEMVTYPQLAKNKDKWKEVQEARLFFISVVNQHTRDPKHHEKNFKSKKGEKFEFVLSTPGQRVVVPDEGSSGGNLAITGDQHVTLGVDAEDLGTGKNEFVKVVESAHWYQAGYRGDIVKQELNEAEVDEKRHDLVQNMYAYMRSVIEQSANIHLKYNLAVPGWNPPGKQSSQAPDGLETGLVKNQWGIIPRTSPQVTLESTLKSNNERNLVKKKLRAVKFSDQKLWDALTTDIVENKATVGSKTVVDDATIGKDKKHAALFEARTGDYYKHFSDKQMPIGENMVKHEVNKLESTQSSKKLLDLFGNAAQGNDSRSVKDIFREEQAKKKAKAEELKKKREKEKGSEHLEDNNKKNVNKEKKPIKTLSKALPKKPKELANKSNKRVRKFTPKSFGQWINNLLGFKYVETKLIPALLDRSPKTQEESRKLVKHACKQIYKKVAMGSTNTGNIDKFIVGNREIDIRERSVGGGFLKVEGYLADFLVNWAKDLTGQNPDTFRPGRNNEANEAFFNNPTIFDDDK